jgi:hypothetical protein
MKNIILAIALGIFFAASAFAQDSLQVQHRYRNANKDMHAIMHQGQNGQHGQGFVDENGDGYNDNAKDDDGDGIPNGMDPDYTGPQMQNGRGHGFIDANGDGINDYAMDDDGDGIPNGQDPDYVRPQDGTGHMNKNFQGKRSGTRGSGFGMNGNENNSPKGKGHGRK